MKYEKPVIVGIDSETNQGPPITLQLYSDDQKNLTRMLWVDENNCTERLLKTLGQHCKPDRLYVLYGHYLQFDFASFFWPHLREGVLQRDGSFEFTRGGWVIKGRFGTPTYVNFTKDKLAVILVDSYSWFRCSLAKAADLVCPHLPKLERVEGLGDKQFKRTDSDFIDYAMRDAEVAYHLGHAVDELHAKYDLSQAVSVADMAARIFRKHYISDPIVRTGTQITKATILSYHGGKNNVIDNAAPAWHRPVTSYDISSAYPYAMTQLPSFTRSDCFGGLRVFSPRSKSVPPVGIYRVSGRADDCAWPALFGHDFKPLRDKIESTWVHGYELNEALRTGEVRLTSLCGFLYDCDRDPCNETAFTKFVRTFYELKANAKTSTHKFLYKVILNSISGKFIQTKEVAEIENGEIVIKRQAAGLFHPFIASSITAHTRATIHQMEHLTNALHTATDGIFAPGNGLTRFPFAPSSGLGSITKEASGELCMLRGKCYLLHTQDAGVGYPSFYRPGWRVAKLAMHGFQGSPKQFEELIFSDRRKYSVERPYRLREALKAGYTPNKFVKRDLVLKVPPLKRLYSY